MESKLVSIKTVKPNQDNPRIIKDDKFEQLVNSIRQFPKMLEIRPIVVNKEMVVLGGNMRLKACEEAGLKKVHIIKVEDLTEEQQKEFIIKDNVGFGEWDWDMLKNEWNHDNLEDWGLDTPFDDDILGDIEEIKDFNESTNFTIRCETMAELEELQKKLAVDTQKIGYKDFLLKSAL